MLHFEERKNMTKLKTGIIGCGNISGIYLENSQWIEAIEIVAVADLFLEAAKAKAEEYNIPKAYTVEEILADSEIDLIINLTIPQAHAEVSLAALEAGKHVYLEKPLAISLVDGNRVLEKAKEKGLLVGCAPDTFLGAGLQTSRKLLDDGWIGEPVAATAFMMGRGPEGWHPNPDFFYQEGAGPLFDMGPYYITTLVHLLGPIRRVTGSSRITLPQRLITSEPKYGQKIDVNIPTHVTSLLDFHNGAIATMVTSFDIFGGSSLPRIELYGTLGTMLIPDPNTFGGPVSIRRHGEENWSEIPLTHGFAENGRGLGVADMAYAIMNSRQHRASGELACHVLETMHSILEASNKGEHITISSSCERPAPFPIGINKHTLHLLNQ
jgi:predicted dehydrogenase